MIATDQDALICDMAETYGIFDLQALPVATLATLAVGLRENSRIKMHMSGAKTSRNELLLAAAVDRLSMLVWAKTEDGHKGINPPKSLVSLMNGEAPDTNDDDIQSFDSPVEFEAEWARITGVSHG